MIGGMNSLHAIEGPIFSSHRGAVDFAPENTLPALEKALDLGISMVEVDVRSSLDGVLYDLHDARVDRTTDGKGRLRLMRSSLVDRLDAGVSFGGDFRGVSVPRVEDILAALKGRAFFYFDVKPGVRLKTLIALVREHGVEEQSLFWFKNPIEALKLKARFPGMMLKVNGSSSDEIRRRSAFYKADVLECSSRAYSPRIAEICRELKLKLMISFHGREEDYLQDPARWQADIFNIHYVRPLLSFLENRSNEESEGDGAHV